MMISNMAAGNVSIQFGFKGKSINDVTACATGTNTIGEAFRSIQYGEADVMIAGGDGGQHLSDRNCRIYGADGTVVRDRSEAMLPAV